MLLGSALTGHIIAAVGPEGLPASIALADLSVAALARHAAPAGTTLRRAQRRVPA